MLAGFAGTLALFWLICGYFQQHQEMKQNTDALLLQFVELRDSVLQQKALVDIGRSDYHKRILPAIDLYIRYELENRCFAVEVDNKGNTLEAVVYIELIDVLGECLETNRKHMLITENEVIKEVFELGDPLIDLDLEELPSGIYLHLSFQAEGKYWYAKYSARKGKMLRYEVHDSEICEPGN